MKQFTFTLYLLPSATMNAAMRQVYVCCGFTVAAAAAIFDDQGIDSLPELRILTDLEVENLCKVIRRPGGSVQNPIEGHAVSLRAENNLKLAAYWLCQQDEVARVVTPAQVLLETDGDSFSRIRLLCQISRTDARKMCFEEPLDSAETMLCEVSNALSDRTFLTAMVANVRVSCVKTSDRCQGIDAAQLAPNWGIGLHVAEKTLKVTTQQGIRTLVHPSLSRRFRTQDRQLRYRRLPIECFTDTLIAKTESRSKNKYAQVFCTAKGMTRASQCVRSHKRMRRFRCSTSVMAYQTLW